MKAISSSCMRAEMFKKHQDFGAVAQDFQTTQARPTTCPPDAFNSHTDLVALEPGQTHSMTVGIHGFAL